MIIIFQKLPNFKKKLTMKRIVFCCMIAAISTGTWAQNATNNATSKAVKSNAATSAASTAATNTPTLKLQLASKINEVDAGITRNDENWAKGSMMKALYFMEQSMGASSKGANMTKKESSQHKLYNKAKELSATMASMVTNHTELISTLRAFNEAMSN